MHYIGLDIHKAFTYGVIEDKEGDVIKEEKFSNTNESFSKFLDVCNPENTKIVMESTGVWEFIYELLEEKGYHVKLANPSKTKAISGAKIKTDAIDAKTLADLLRANMILESYVPTREMRLLREKVRNRNVLVRTRTKIINKIKAILNRQGVNLLQKRWSKLSEGWIEKQEFRNKDIVMMHIRIMNKIEEEINVLEQGMEDLVQESEDAQLLMSIPGIRMLSAVSLVSEIADVNRFSDSSKLACYAGLVPGLRQSGNTSFNTGLIKQSSRAMKEVLVRCTWSAIRRKETNTLQIYYKRLVKKKGKQKAVCATARKMATVVHAILKDKKEFIA